MGTWQVWLQKESAGRSGAEKRFRRVLPEIRGYLQAEIVLWIWGRVQFFPIMRQLTITEALAEIKTINKRLESKRESVRNYIARDVRVRDPLEKEGGSAEFIKRERQAIIDLEERIVN